MDLDGRRESTNVEDRRGMSGGTKFGLGGGIMGIIIALVAMFMGGGDLGSILGQMGQMGGGITMQESTDNNGQPVEFTQEEQELASFSKKVLGGTEDIWSQIFEQQGLGEYKNPKMVLYTGSTSTACGQGQAAMGPFYCSGDQCLYIDLSFFSSMEQQLGAGGDFSYAYVIAHEVGHHVQYLLGTLGKAHEQMSRLSQSEANKISVQLELQADNYAGVWAHHEQKMFGSLEDGDLEEALGTAQVIGDDYLQKKAQGYVVPESFNHGTSQQRMKWFKRGFTTGDIAQGNTFAYRYDQL